MTAERVSLSLSRLREEDELVNLICDKIKLYAVHRQKEKCADLLETSRGEHSRALGCHKLLFSVKAMPL